MPWDHSLDLPGIKMADLFRKNNIRQDRYDATMYGDLVKASPELQSLAGSGSKIFPELTKDIWSIFYKTDPEHNSIESVSPAYQPNRFFTEKILEDAATKEARITTMLDELSSALATLNAGKHLAEEINNRPDLKEAMDKAHQAARQERDGNFEASKGLSQEAQQLLQGAARDVRRAVKTAIEKGGEKAQETQSVLAGWGLEPGDLNKMQIGERLEFAQRLVNPRMKKVADLVGRMRNLAQSRQKEKLKKCRDEIHGISVGDNIGRLLPAELGALAHPVRKLDFYRRLQERQLLQYQLRTSEPQGRGPIIALIDASGSMAGQRMDWATAVALALVDTARRQKRRTMIIHFNTQILQRVEFAPREKAVEKMLQVATVGTSGGTDYQPSLEEAVAAINAAGYQKADVVLVTDGACALPENFLSSLLETKKAMNFRCWSILIGDSDPSGGLSGWCDQVWPIADVMNDPAVDAAGGLFQEIY